MNSLVVFNDDYRYYLYAGHASMRKSFDGLCGIIRSELGHEVNERDVFIFLNKNRTHVKLLLHETDGFTMLYRRLDKGRFTLPGAPASDGSILLSATDLYSLLNGLQLHRYRKTG